MIQTDRQTHHQEGEDRQDALLGTCPLHLVETPLGQEAEQLLTVLLFPHGGQLGDDMGREVAKEGGGARTTLGGENQN